MKRLEKLGLFAILWVGTVLPTYAEFPDNPDGGGDPFPPEAPIDNWLTILVIAAIIVGMYAVYKNRRKSIA